MNVFDLSRPSCLLERGACIPPDVFYNILENVDDLTFLWTTCRSVSQDFRAAVDLVFIRCHLPRTVLLIDCGLDLIQYAVLILPVGFACLPKEHGMVSFKSSFTLSGLNRSNRAVAAMDTFKKHLRHKLVERLKVQFPKANLSHRPRSIVQVNNYANDTRLCDMKAQWDELRLTINWKNTFTDLFAEEDAYELHIRKTVSH